MVAPSIIVQSGDLSEAHQAQTSDQPLDISDYGCHDMEAEHSTGANTWAAPGSSQSDNVDDSESQSNGVQPVDEAGNVEALSEEEQSRQNLNFLMQLADYEWNDQKVASSHDSRIHHFNFFGDSVFGKNATPPAVSLVVAVAGAKAQFGGPGPDGDNDPHGFAVMSNAMRWVDPIIYHGPLEDLQQFRGERLREAVTGLCDKFYTEHGSWKYDEYDPDEDRPVMDEMHVLEYPQGSLPVNGWYGNGHVVNRYDLRRGSCELASLREKKQRAENCGQRGSPLRQMTTAQELNEGVVEAVEETKDTSTKEVFELLPNTSLAFDLDQDIGQGMGNWADEMQDEEDALLAQGVAQAGPSTSNPPPDTTGADEDMEATSVHVLLSEPGRNKKRCFSDSEPFSRSKKARSEPSYAGKFKRPESEHFREATSRDALSITDGPEASKPSMVFSAHFLKSIEHLAQKSQSPTGLPYSQSHPDLAQLAAKQDCGEGHCSPDFASQAEGIFTPMPKPTHEVKRETPCQVGKLEVVSDEDEDKVEAKTCLSKKCLANCTYKEQYGRLSQESNQEREGNRTDECNDSILDNEQWSSPVSQSQRPASMTPRRMRRGRLDFERASDLESSHLDHDEDEETIEERLRPSRHGFEAVEATVNWALYTLDNWSRLFADHNVDDNFCSTTAATEESAPSTRAVSPPVASSSSSLSSSSSSSPLGQIDRAVTAIKPTSVTESSSSWTKTIKAKVKARLSPASSDLPSSSAKSLLKQLFLFSQTNRKETREKLAPETPEPQPKPKPGPSKLKESRPNPNPNRESNINHNITEPGPKSTNSTPTAKKTGKRTAKQIWQKVFK